MCSISLLQFGRPAPGLLLGRRVVSVVLVGVGWLLYRAGALRLQLEAAGRER